MMIYRNDQDRCPAILMSAKGSLGFLNLNSITQIIQSSPALRTPRYFGPVFFVPGERKPLHSCNSTRLIYGHPVTTNTFYGPLSVRINGV